MYAEKHLLLEILSNFSYFSAHPHFDNYPEKINLVVFWPVTLKVSQGSLTHFQLANVPLLYLLKTLEDWRFSDVSIGCRSATLIVNGLR